MFLVLNLSCLHLELIISCFTLKLLSLCSSLTLFPVSVWFSLSPIFLSLPALMSHVWVSVPPPASCSSLSSSCSTVKLPQASIWLVSFLFTFCALTKAASALGLLVSQKTVLCSSKRPPLFLNSPDIVLKISGATDSDVCVHTFSPSGKNACLKVALESISSRTRTQQNDLSFRFTLTCPKSNFGQSLRLLTFFFLQILRGVAFMVEAWEQ